jgi:uncharacterized protein YjaG (DUF416 family)
MPAKTGSDQPNQRPGIQASGGNGDQSNHRSVAKEMIGTDILPYDEAATVARLEKMAPQMRVLFALQAAQRLLPAYRQYAQTTGRGRPEVIEGIADRLWRDLGGNVMDEAELAQVTEEVMELIPDENESWDEETQPYAEDAAAALAYALRGRRNGDPQEAAWAARRAYEATDHLVMAATNATLGGPAARAIIANPMIQAELRRQQRDLLELSRMGEVLSQDVVLELRKRAEHESHVFRVPST